MMYFWEETYENIWDSAPRVKPQEKGRPECLCEKQRLRELLGALLDLLDQDTPQTLVATLRSHIQDGLCCCKKKCLHQKFNLPQEAYEQQLWDLYTFYLNAFNVYSQDKTRLSEDTVRTPLEDNTHTVPGGENELQGDATECEVLSDSPDGAAVGEGAKKPECCEDLTRDILDVLEKCVRHGDVHVYVLLQDLKAALQCLHSLDNDDSATFSAETLMDETNLEEEEAHA